MHKFGNLRDLRIVDSTVNLPALGQLELRGLNQLQSLHLKTVAFNCGPQGLQKLDIFGHMIGNACNNLQEISLNINPRITVAILTSLSTTVLHHLKCFCDHTDVADKITGVLEKHQHSLKSLRIAQVNWGFSDIKFQGNFNQLERLTIVCEMEKLQSCVLSIGRICPALENLHLLIFNYELKIESCECKEGNLLKWLAGSCLHLRYLRINGYTQHRLITATYIRSDTSPTGFRKLIGDSGPE